MGKKRRISVKARHGRFVPIIWAEMVKILFKGVCALLTCPSANESAPQVNDLGDQSQSKVDDESTSVSFER